MPPQPAVGSKPLLLMASEYIYNNNIRTANANRSAPPCQIMAHKKTHTPFTWREHSCYLLSSIPSAMVRAFGPFWLTKRVVLLHPSPRNRRASYTVLQLRITFLEAAQLSMEIHILPPRVYNCAPYSRDTEHGHRHLGACRHVH